MTAMTVVESFDNTLSNEGAVKIAYLTGSNASTHTPSNSSGKTIRIIGANSVSGSAVVATVSSGVITFNTGLGSDENFVLAYTMT